MRQRGQSGASLVIVMAFMAFLAVIVPTVLGLANTGLAVTEPVVEDRRALYAAASALDAAIRLGDADADVGVPGGPCPDTSAVVDGLEVRVDCQGHPAPVDGCHYLDRFVTYTAEVRRPGDTAVHSAWRPRSPTASIPTARRAPRSVNGTRMPSRPL
ncbi:MAG: hypothetical protein M5U19_01550 [Microthrixaceae bacterium]|nr:hypothetical protein [Microthrixaceae bacterium]